MTNATVGALRVSLGLDTAAFQNGLKNANSKLKTFGMQAAKIGAALSVVSTGLVLGLRSQLQFADDLGKTAQKIGVPVEALSRLKHAADLSGVSMSTLQTGLGRLSRSMAEARDGTAAAVDAFARVGVAVTDVEGKLRPTEDVLADLADAFARAPDGAQKTAIAMELLGRGGAEMIPLLNGGADALRAMGEEAERMGLVISEGTFRAAETFNDNVLRLTKSVGALGTMITAELAPTLAKFSDMVVSVAQRFQGMSPELRKFAASITLIGIALGPVITALGLLALAAGALGGPITLAIVAVAGLTAAVVTFWETAPQIFERVGFAAEAVGNTFAAVAAGFESAFLSAFASVLERAAQWANAITGIVNPILEALNAPTLSAAGISEAAAQIRNSAGLAGELAQSEIALAGFALDAVTAPLERVSDASERVRSEMAETALVAQDFADGLSGGGGGGGSGGGGRGVKGAALDAAAAIDALGVEAEGLQEYLWRTEDEMRRLEQGADAMKRGMSDAFTDAVTGAKSLQGAIGDLLTELGRLAINNAFMNILGGFGGGGGIGGFLAGAFAPPRYANGTRFHPGGLAVVGERGQELVNLPRGSQVTPLSAMREQGGRMDVRVFVDDGGNWRAAVENISGAVAARVSEQAVGAYDRGLPDRLARVNSDPWRRG